MWRELETMSSPGETDSVREVLDRASLVHQLLVARSLRVHRARHKARGASLEYL